MSADVPADAPIGPGAHTAPKAARPRRQTHGKSPAHDQPREVIYRHTVLVRLTHWINALAIFLLVGTGLNIFNAHPQLYWGKAGADFDRPVLSIHPYPGPHGTTRGEAVIGPLHVDTTGVLGWSQQNGHWTGRAWPSWLTVPSFTDLADARHWHFLLAWVLAVNGLAYLVWSLAIRHVQRDLWPTLADLRAIPRSVWDHMRLRHPTGEAAKRYNVLQRLAYLGLIALVLGMVSTGLSMSPGFNAFAPWLLDLFGGRQSARTLHFACMILIVLFIAVHLIEVVLAGPINEVRSMITGRYAVPAEHD